MSNIFRRGKSFKLSSSHLIRKDAIGARSLIAKEFFEASSGSIIGSSTGLATNNSTLNALAILSGNADGTVGGSNTISALGTLIAILSGVASQNADLTEAAGYSNIIGSSDGIATSSALLVALGSLAGSGVGVATNSSTIGAVGALGGNSDGIATQNSIMLAVKLMTGNSSSGGGATSEELYNSKLAIAEVISRLKIITGTGAGYTISGNSGTLPITSLELSNLQSELIAELNKLKIRLVH